MLSSAGVIFAFVGAVLSSVGAAGKVLVPGGGSDNLLASAKPPARLEEL
jgi:hypothetical protein